MIAPLPFPFNLLSFSAWAPVGPWRTAAPAPASAVESRPAAPPRAVEPGVRVGSAPDSDATIFDVWTRGPHGGSADLVEHPATHVELALAKCELDGDEGAYDALLAYTLTAERTAAVLGQARRIARAEQIWARHA